jgi:hypothetical protein
LDEKSFDALLLQQCNHTCLRKTKQLMFNMTESDLPYIKPELEIPSETNGVTPPSPDVKNPLPHHDPNEKLETEAFICPVCGKSFQSKTDLDWHVAKKHGQIKKA